MTGWLRGGLRWGYDRVWHLWPAMLLPLMVKFRRDHGHWPHLWRPRTFNEKVLWRMVFDRRPVLTRLAGKLESRAYVRERVGEAYLIPLLAVIRDAAEIRGAVLPARFVMKANHGSGMVHIHFGDAEPDRAVLEALARRWLALDFGKYSREWIYRGVERVVVIEALLAGPDGRVAWDYKFLCYGGVARIIELDRDRFDGQTQDFVDRDWQRIAVRRVVSPAPSLPDRPEQWDELLRVAGALSAGMDFLRVDLYATPDGVRCGELTTTPQAAEVGFSTWAWDLEFGRQWKLSRGDVDRTGAYVT